MADKKRTVSIELDRQTDPIDRHMTWMARATGVGIDKTVYNDDAIIALETVMKIAADDWKINADPRPLRADLRVPSNVHDELSAGKKLPMEYALV